MARSKQSATRPANTGRPESTTRIVAWWLFLAALFVVPLATSNLTWMGPNATALTSDQFDVVKAAILQLCLLGALAAWLADGVRARELESRWARPLVALAAFLGWAVIATVVSPHPPTALFGDYARPEGLIGFIDYALALLLGLNLVDGLRRAKIVARTVVASAVLVSLYGLLQYFRVDPLRWGSGVLEQGRVFSTFGNPDILGGFLVMGLVLAPTLALSEEDRRLRGSVWIASGLIAAALVVTFVRSAWIGGLVGLGLVVFGALRAKAKLERFDLILGAVAVAMVLVAGGLSLSSQSAVTNVVQRVASTVQIGSGSARQRVLIWRGAVEAVAERPLLGWGPGSFRNGFARHEPAELVVIGGHLGAADDAHDWPLQLAVGTGVVGALLALAFLGWSLGSTARVAFGPSESQGSVVLAGMWAAVAGYLVYLALSPSVVGATFVAWALLGVLLVPVSRSVRLESPLVWLAFGGAGLLILAGAWVSVASLRADALAFRALTGPDTAARIAAADAASRTAPWETSYRSLQVQTRIEAFSEAAVAIAAAKSQGASPDQATSVARQVLDDALARIDEATAFNSQDYGLLVNRAVLLNRASSLFGSSYAAEAEVTAREAQALRPTGADAIMQLGLAQANQGRLPDAVATLKQALDLDPGFAQASLLLARVMNTRGQTPEARAVLEAALAQKRPSEGDAVFDDIGALLKSLEATSAP